MSANWVKTSTFSFGWSLVSRSSSASSFVSRSGSHRPHVSRTPSRRLAVAARSFGQLRDEQVGAQPLEAFVYVSA